MQETDYMHSLSWRYPKRLGHVPAIQISRVALCPVPSRLPLETVTIPNICPIHFLLSLSHRTLAGRNVPALILTTDSVEGARSLMARGGLTTPLLPSSTVSKVQRQA